MKTSVKVKEFIENIQDFLTYNWNNVEYNNENYKLIDIDYEHLQIILERNDEDFYINSDEKISFLDGTKSIKNIKQKLKLKTDNLIIDASKITSTNIVERPQKFEVIFHLNGEEIKVKYDTKFNILTYKFKEDFLYYIYDLIRKKEILVFNY